MKLLYQGTLEADNLTKSRVLNWPGHNSHDNLPGWFIIAGMASRVGAADHETD